MRYLINRKSGEYNPTAFFRAAYGVSAADKTAGTYLQAVMGENVGFADLVTDFYTAIAADESSGRYGFEGDAVVQSTLNDYPYYVGGSGSEVSPFPDFCSDTINVLVQVVCLFGSQLVARSFTDLHIIDDRLSPRDRLTVFDIVAGIS